MSRYYGGIFAGKNLFPKKKKNKNIKNEIIRGNAWD
jgi:hypothetical protein